MHLDSIPQNIQNMVKNVSVINTGDYIADTGESGSVVSPHLHLDLRVGTSCSLEYQVKYPNKSCASYGFDPHFNPFLLLTNTPSTYTTIPQYWNNGDLVFKITMFMDTSSINRLTYLWDQNGSVTSYILDFNERISFDATSTAALDTQDKTKPYIEVYKRIGRYRVMEVVIPAVYLVNVDVNDLHSLEIMDTFQNVQTVS